MPIDEFLLKILVCPEDKTSLKPIDPVLLSFINDKISKNTVKNRAGIEVRDPLDGALLREDGKFLYPIREEIPVMLVEEAIPTEQFEKE